MIVKVPRRSVVKKTFFVCTPLDTVMPLLRILQGCMSYNQHLGISRDDRSSDSRNVRKRKPFVTFVGIVRDPSVVEPGHKQKYSEDGKSDACQVAPKYK